MTDAEAFAYHARNPQMPLATIAIHAGYDSADRDIPCRFTDPALVADWKYGFRMGRAEAGLDADTEWG